MRVHTYSGQKVTNGCPRIHMWVPLSLRQCSVLQTAYDFCFCATERTQSHFHSQNMYTNWIVNWHSLVSDQAKPQCWLVVVPSIYDNFNLVNLVAAEMKTKKEEKLPWDTTLLQNKWGVSGEFQT